MWSASTTSAPPTETTPEFAPLNAVRRIPHPLVQAVLFDSDQDQKPFAFPDLTTFDCLEVRFPEGSPDFKDLDPGLCLLLYVDDLASPRARVRLVDIVRQGGQRPLNILRQAGQVVRLVLADPAGTWKHVAPKFEVALGCR